MLGATGRQGGAVARALLDDGWPVRAFVRDPGAKAARALAERGAELTVGDLDDPASLDPALRGAHGAFSVQSIAPPGGVAAEERQGRAVVDAAVRAGLAHLVYSSVGGAERAGGVPHFASKWRVEQHLRASGLPATVVRPVFFMENLPASVAAGADGALALRLALRTQTPLQMVAVRDVGRFAAAAFADPAAHAGRAVELAGDELAPPQIAQALAAAAGQPVAFAQQPIDRVRAYSADIGAMFDWLEAGGYRADVPALREQLPGLMRLTDWLAATGWAPPRADATRGER